MSKSIQDHVARFTEPPQRRIIELEMENAELKEKIQESEKHRGFRNKSPDKKNPMPKIAEPEIRKPANKKKHKE